MSNRQPWTRRHFARVRVLAVFAVASAIIPIVTLVAIKPLDAPLQLRKRIGYVSLVGMVCFGGVAGVLALTWFSPVRRLIKEANGRVCGNCLFRLEGLAASGICPECGSWYDIEQTVDDWFHDLEIPGDRSTRES